MQIQNKPRSYKDLKNFKFGNKKAISLGLTCQIVKFLIRTIQFIKIRSFIEKEKIR